MLKSIVKGKNGEKEFSEILSVILGTEVIVNPHANGADIRSIPGLAIEVKRSETLNINKWWEQTLIQAESTNRNPVLVYRQNRKAWNICLPARFLIPKNKNDYITCNLAVFTEWLLEFTRT